MKRYFIIYLLLISWLDLLAQSVIVTQNDVELRRESFIEDFLQTYQSAYEKKHIDYITSFFSTDALIITETKELVKCGEEMIPHSPKKRPYKLVVEDKKEYIVRLHHLFNTIQHIKLSMSGVRIIKHSLYPEVYGVSFMQMWMDDSTEEHLENQMPGCIFLMIDFKNNESQPIIHVRTWQPKDNITKPQDKFNLNDFVIYDFK